MGNVQAADAFQHGLEQTWEHQQQPGQQKQAALDRRRVPDRPVLRCDRECAEPGTGHRRNPDDVVDRAALGDLEQQAYAQRIADNAQALADGFLKRDAHLITGGTDNHLVLLDVTSFGLTGRQAESALLDAGVVTNRNAIPADPNGAWYTSGIRLGSPALTTRGFGPADFDRVAELMVDVLANTKPEGTSKAKYSLADGTAERVSAAAAELLDANPLYPGLAL